MFEDDKNLLARARTFDIDALAMVYDRYNTGIYRYAMRLMGDENFAEECVADTFSRFLAALQTGHGPKDHLQAYLYRTAHNWVTDQFRSHSHEMVELDECIHANEQDLPEQQMEIRQKQAHVRKALQSLTPEQSLVVTLKYLEGWENPEIAAVLKRTVGSVKALQHRALDSLRKSLLDLE
jgi:RNA polymerase sigma-70 factor (ECF subfamily)